MEPHRSGCYLQDPQQTAYILLLAHWKDKILLPCQISEKYIKHKIENL